MIRFRAWIEISFRLLRTCMKLLPRDFGGLINSFHTLLLLLLFFVLITMHLNHKTLAGVDGLFNNVRTIYRLTAVLSDTRPPNAKSLRAVAVSLTFDRVSKKPEKVILHIGTNNLRKSDAKSVADGIVNLAQSIEQQCPDTEIIVSGIISRSDVISASSRVRETNELVKSVCNQKIGFLYLTQILRPHI